MLVYLNFTLMQTALFQHCHTSDSQSIINNSHLQVIYCRSYSTFAVMMYCAKVASSRSPPQACEQELQHTHRSTCMMFYSRSCISCNAGMPTPKYLDLEKRGSDHLICPMCKRFPKMPQQTLRLVCGGQSKKSSTSTSRLSKSAPTSLTFVPLRMRFSNVSSNPVSPMSMAPRTRPPSNTTWHR